MTLAVIAVFIVSELPPELIWRLPAEAKGHVLARAGAAARNLEAVRRGGVQVISIGQNCLPYQLGGRWGFIAARADQAALTPFDLGGFTNDTAAAAITTGFDMFDDRRDFVVTKAWGGGRMYLHQPTGVGFFHERGSHWVTGDGSRFFTRLALMKTSWQLANRAARRLYVFALCGAGDLARLVRAADEKLLDERARLLIIDVLQEPHDCPAHPRVTYRHVPYPKNYDWSSVFQQCTAAGFAFERSVVAAVEDCLASFEQAAPGGIGRGDVVGRAWRFGPANGLALGENFCFREDGRIAGYENDNEHGWVCENGYLKILKRGGEVMWIASAVTREDGTAHIRLTTPHEAGLEFYLTAVPEGSAPAHRYAGRLRVLMLTGGLEIAARLPAALEGAEIIRIGSADEIDAHGECDVFISGLLLSHARSAAEAAGLIARAAARFPVAMFFELSAHQAAYLESLGLRSLHQGFAENTFMNELSLDFFARAADAPGVYKVEHYAAVPAFDSFKEWVVPAGHPPGAYHAEAGRKPYVIFDRPVFEFSVYISHGFAAPEISQADGLTLVEARLLRFRGQASGFRLDHIVRPGEIGRLLYNTLRDAPAALRGRPVSLPAVMADHPVPPAPRHEAVFARWRAESKVEIAELSVHEFGPCVVGGTGTLFADGKFVFGTDYLLMFLNASSLDPIMRGLQRRHPAGHVGGVAIVGFNALYDNYYHWVAEAMASVSLCLDLLAARGESGVTLITGQLNGVRREYLEILLRGGPPVGVVELERDQFVTADQVVYCDNVGRQVHQQVCWEEVGLAQKMLSHAGLLECRPHRMIYVARTDTTGRVMTNEPALIARLAAMGFEIFVGGAHKVAEQMRVFREARVVVGPHGAGLTNLIYCHPKTVVLELHQSGYVNTGMMRLAQLGDLDYVSEMTFVSEAEEAAGAWSVDVDRVVTVVRRLLPDRAAG